MCAPGDEEDGEGEGVGGGRATAERADNGRQSNPPALDAGGARPGVEVHDGNTAGRGDGRRYSVSCGIALVDDASLSAVCRPTLNTLEELNSARRDVEAGGEDRMPAVISPQELQESALVRNLIRLATEDACFLDVSQTGGASPPPPSRGLQQGTTAGDDGTKAGVHDYCPV